MGSCSIRVKKPFTFCPPPNRSTHLHLRAMLPRSKNAFSLTHHAIAHPPSPSYCVSITRWYATKRAGEDDDAELAAARRWLSNLDPDTIPRDMCEVSFSRSSGPGGQNVNK